MEKVTFTNYDGETETRKIGDYVGFKCDIEQSGKIVEIKRGQWGIVLVLENDNGFEGGYIGGDRTTTVDLDQIW